MANSKYAAFIAAAEEGNMTAAAQKLGYTQSGVSHLVHTLEQELGVQLLIRSKAGVELSPEGNALIGHIRRLIAVSYTHLDVYKRQVFHYFRLDFVVNPAAIFVILGAGLGRDGEALGNRQAYLGHFGQIGALTAQQVAHGSVAFAELVNVLFRH